MTVSVTVEGLDAARKRLGSMDTRIRKAMVDQIQNREVPPAVARMRSKASNGHMRAAAGTVRIERDRDGATIHGGGGGGLGATVFAGAEFGGRKRRRTYAMRRRGSAFVMHRRRTTMQFLTHLGKRGYFFWPSVREKFTGIAARTARRVQDEVNSGG